MSSLPLAKWDHALFDELQHILARVASQPTTSLIRRLYSKLEEAQPWILALTSLPGPSDADRQSVEKDPIHLPSGTSVHVSGELLGIVTQISNHLVISQILSAVLALQAEEERPRFPSRSIVEISVYILHGWTTQMLEFLRELLRLTIGPNAPTGEPFDALREWVEDLLNMKTSMGANKPERSIAENILGQVDEAYSRLNSLLGSRQTGAEYDLQSFRIAAIRAEQSKLVGILAATSLGGYLGRGDTIALLKWLKRCDRLDPLVGSILCTFFAATRPLDALDQDDARLQTAEGWCRDIKFLKVASQLTFQDDWATPRLRESAKISWALFILSALRHDASVSQIDIDPSTAEQYFLDGVNGEAFQILREIAMVIRRERGLEQDENSDASEDALFKIAKRTDAENDPFIFSQMQDLIDTIATRKYFLRNLRNKEEDNATRRSQATPPAANFQAFMALLASVYKTLPPDQAIGLWDNPNFTAAVFDSRARGPTLAFWEMLTAISAGSICAGRCYEKLKDGRAPWYKLWEFYAHYPKHMPHLYEPIKSNRNVSLEPVEPEEVEQLRMWSDVLTTVVRWSVFARGALLQSKPQPLQLMFDLINCDVPLDLKTSVLQAINAFCRRTGDPVDDDVISKAIEYYEQISYIDAGLDTRNMDMSRLPGPIGWIAKMEYTEQDAKIYPLTRAYITFLTILLPSYGPTRPRLLSTLRRGAYYILDRALLLPDARGYARESERWETLDAVLAFIEKALLSFNMSELLVQSNSRAIGQIATSLADEVGFTMLLRILSEQTIFNLLAGVLDTAAAIPSPRPSRVNNVLTRLLRIYHRILDIQLVFSDILLLTLTDPTRNPTSTFRRPLSLQSLDHYLLGHLSNINAIALLVGDDNLPISLLSAKITSSLATSPIFSRSDIFRGEYATSINRLAGVIDASDDSIRIAQGFCTRLNDGDGDDLAPERAAEVEENILRGEISARDIDALPLVIRSAILDLLVEGTLPDTGPNIAHFLLGFDFKGTEFVLQDPRSPESRLSCLQIVLNQLNEGTDTQGRATNTIMDLHPTLAAKSARLIHQLFSDSYTGRSAMSYATSNSGFSARQLAALPLRCPVVTYDALGRGTVSNHDSEIITTADTLIAFLDFQRWILSAAALEIFAFDGHGASASIVAQLLFEGTETEEGTPSGSALAIDLLNSIDIQWKEDEDEDNRNLEFFGSYDFNLYKRSDIDWWDLSTLGRSMKAYQKQLERQGAITATQSSNVSAEADFVLNRLAVKNRETDISIAKGSFLTSWNEALKVSLAMLFSQVEEEKQEIVLFELLDALLNRFDNDLAPGVMEIICESVLVVMTTLVNNLQGFEGVNLPIEQLSMALLKIVEAVTRPGATESARGNLFAAISQHLQLNTFAGPTHADDASTIGGNTAVPGGSAGLQRATMQVFGQRKDRFFAVLCRDAMDDRDVWKTECLALLGAIVSICQSERDRQLLSPLMGSGFLPLLVRSIKDREIAVQECLSPDYENLHSYWVYEAKISFLMAVAASRKGAEDLLDAGIFEVFSMCGFIAVQPLTEEHADDSLATEFVARQHRVLICALQLLARTLSSLHKSGRSGAGHGISFLNAHRESVLSLLRDSQQNVTVTGIEELSLIVSILGMVSHKVPSVDLRSPSGFGAYHLSVLAVAACFFDRDTWIDNLVYPEELRKAESLVLSLNQLTLAYLCSTTTGLKGDQGFPVFVSGTPRGGNETTKYIASAPSLQMAVALLSELTEALSDLSGEYEALLDRLQDGGHLDEADVAKQKLHEADLLLDAFGSAEDAKIGFAARSHTIFYMVESLLLLLWRHLLYYANDARGALNPVKPNTLSLSSGVFASSQSEMSRGSNSLKLLERIAANLRGSLDRLEDVDVHTELRRKGSESYYAMLIRRLGELTAGLTGDFGTGDASS